MNKKFKLFSTIASLCLAVALMAFGVWAATSVKVTVSGSVSFAATANVKAKIYTKQTYTNIAGKTSNDEFAQKVELDGSETNDAGKEFNEQTINLDATNLSATAGTVGTVKYKYEIKIENTALDSDTYKTLVVKVTYPTATGVLATEGYIVTVTNMSNTDATAVETKEVSIRESVTYSVEIEINANADIKTAIDLGSVIELSMKA